MTEIINKFISIILENIKALLYILFEAREYIINFVNEFFIEKIAMSNIFLTANIAIITTLIPIAIAIFNDERDFQVLDKILIIDYIVRAKVFPFYLFLLFLPFIFFHTEYFYLKLVAIFVWLYAILFFIGILKRTYYWIKMNRYKYRYEYLQKQNTPEDIEQSWNSFWKSKRIDDKNERDFFKVFAKKIENFINTEENVNSVLKLLSDFSDYIHLRKISTLALEGGVLSRILDWDKRIYYKKKEVLNINSKNLVTYTLIDTHLKNIFNNISERALNENCEYSFFEILGQYINKSIPKEGNKNKENEIKYINNFMQRFYIKFFEIIEKSEGTQYGVWEHFPKNWKITYDSLIDKNILSNISLNVYLEWAQRRIWQFKKSFDKALDEVSEYLFPEVEPGTWARIMLLIFNPYVKNRMKEVIERKWNFGWISRVFSGDAPRQDFEVDIGKKMKQQEQNTYKLALLIFKGHLNKDNLNNDLNELKNLKYDEKSDFEIKRIKLLRTFEGLLSMANETP